MGYLQPTTVHGRRGYTVHNPVDGREVFSFAVDTAAEVKEKVARARAVQPAWAATPVKERARLMQKALDLLVKRNEALAAELTLETGRAALDTLMIELYAVADSMNYYSKRAESSLREQSVGLHLLRHKKARLVPRPLGVVAVISPWNGPFVLSTNPTVQALLAGNAVIIKPSEATPMAGVAAAKLFADAGFPPDLVQVALGDGETGAALLDAGVDKVSFTGSVRTGRKVGEVCGRNLIPCTLELGGKDAMIVCADADLERAAGGALFGGLMNAGQFCSAVERIYVDATVAEAFTSKVVAKVKQLELGRDIGPFIFEPQCAIVADHVEDAVAKGATLRTGGRRNGPYYLPTVLTGVTHQMRLMTEETFGPVLPIATFRTEDEAIALANDNRYGLSASVWSKNGDRALALAKRLQAGSVTINETALTYGALELPFGGVKESGVGRVNGADGLLNYSQLLPIIADRFGRAEEAVWYPYTPEKVTELRKGLTVLFGSFLRRLL